MLLLDFDEHVERFEAQPVTIPVPGIPKGYTPNVLVCFRPDPNSGDIRKPLFTEVKHTVMRSNFVKNRSAGKFTVILRVNLPRSTARASDTRLKSASLSTITDEASRQS